MLCEARRCALLCVASKIVLKNASSVEQRHTLYHCRLVHDDLKHIVYT